VTRQHATLLVRAGLSLAFIVGYGWIVLKFIGSSVAVTQEVKEILIFLFGALTTSVVTIVNFWFSSSQGSADKDKRE
jgi:hypothetical protein